jgi:hypothetical protein
MHWPGKTNGEPDIRLRKGKFTLQTKRLGSLAQCMKIAQGVPAL